MVTLGADTADGTEKFDDAGFGGDGLGAVLEGASSAAGCG
jgi:hypothetical protein